MSKIPLKNQFRSKKLSFLAPASILSLMIFIMFLTLSSFQTSEQDEMDNDVSEEMATTEEMESDFQPQMDAEAEIEGEEAQEATVVDESSDDPEFIRGEYTSRQTRRGERLFNGLVAFESGLHDCSSCHYIDAQKEINWNPASWEMAEVWAGEEDYSIMEIMNNPATLRLMEEHEGMTITEEEQHLLEAYYVKLLEEGPAKLKAYPVKAAIFWGLGALMLLAIVDLLITRKVPFKAIHLFILFVGLAVHGQFAVAEAQNLGRTEGYAPDQPIKFSHLIHSKENDIDCQYCHFTADYSISANIPSNNVCMNCHNVVLEGTMSGAFEINKIHRAAETGEPIEWIRVHKLPDHSFFSHAQHVNAGKQECTDCHGEVENMHIVQQVEDLSMGWCLTCHRENEVDFFDNPYFEIYERLHEMVKNGEIEGVTSADIGGEDCMSCHY